MAWQPGSSPVALHITYMGDTGTILAVMEGGRVTKHTYIRGKQEGEREAAMAFRAYCNLDWRGEKLLSV